MQLRVRTARAASSASAQSPARLLKRKGGAEAAKAEALASVSPITKGPKPKLRRASLRTKAVASTAARPDAESDDAEGDKSEVTRAAPANWKQMLEGIQTMRAAGGAEVDSMGCEIYKKDTVPAHEWRFHTLVSAMLSSQTKDPVNAAAMERLMARDGGLTVQAMLVIDESELAQTIHPVGFYRNKAKYIKQVASILTARASGAAVVDIPDTFEGLLALPGVGPKMAYLVMDCAWSNVAGICVDTHVHRISNRLGWVTTWNKKNPKAQDPEKTRRELQDWLPREHWGPLNLLLVGFGQTICQPRAPKCDECSITHLCPSAHRSTI
ncbi:hypothetical protein PybrP1_007482 [[Pythium] brassicae (nom. inval.)]|nr:hypothetical protein PybrP1_007482 [[Pythium] brassicae (nom. inval.)]